MSSSEIANITRFDAEAAAWDSNPGHVECVKLAVSAILQHLPQLAKYRESGEGHADGLDALEIGCGTGLLSFALAPYVRSLLGVDITPGMLAAFDIKVADAKARNDPLATKLASLCLGLAHPDDPSLQSKAAALMEANRLAVQKPVRWDLIFSHLTLHHIPSLREILAAMFQALKSGGRVALTDFEDFGKDAILFHPESKRDGVERHGITRVEMETLMKGVGLVDVQVIVAFTFKKKVDEREEDMAFPFLLCLGTKP